MNRSTAYTLIRQIKPDNSAELEYFRLHRSRYVDTLRLLSQSQVVGKTVLDIGTLPCHLALSCKRFGATRVIGVDYDPNRFNTQSALEAQGLEIVQCDVEHEVVPIADKSVDVILFTEVIEHFEDGPEHCVSELKRVLSPEGRVILTTPNICNLANRIRVIFGRPIYPVHEGPTRKQLHHHEYSMAELLEVVQKAGFNVEKKGYIAGSEKALVRGAFPTRIPYPLAFLYALVPLLVPFLRSYLFIVITHQ